MGIQAPIEQVFSCLQRQLTPLGLQLHSWRLNSLDLPTLGQYNIPKPGINAVVATDINLATWLEVVA